MDRERKAQYLTGIRAAVPVILGFVPTGMAYGIMARQAGLSVLQTCGMSLSVFAGASQMMAVGMLEQGAGLLAITLATFILNLRHLIMSTCVMNRMGHGSTKIKLLAAFGVTDESFALFTSEDTRNCSAFFFLGLITVTYLSWNVGSLIGAVASDLLPEIITASLGIALYAMFIGILVPGLKGNWQLGALVVFTALCNTILSQIIPSSWSLIVSTLLCAFIGTFCVDLEEKEEEK